MNATSSVTLKPARELAVDDELLAFGLEKAQLLELGEAAARAGSGRVVKTVVVDLQTAVTQLALWPSVDAPSRERTLCLPGMSLVAIAKHASTRGAS